ncbi:MAG: VWA domain-containing protein [Parachlamydiales bacterium]|jgi:Ca-activated chloride channel family protein
MMGVDLLGCIASLFIAGLAVLSGLWFRNQTKPTVALSTPITQSDLNYKFYLTPFLFGGAFLCMLVALADPYYSKEVSFNKASPLQEQGKPPPVEGIAIYLVLDQSGSMEGEVLNKGDNGKRYQTTKLKLLKGITEKFILGDDALNMQGRPNDLMGIVGFSRGAQVISPLTLDHKELVKRLKKFDIMRANDQDGTSIGYAIYKTANLILATRHFAEELIAEGKPAYTIQSYAIILVTDGVQENNPLDKGKKWRNIPIEEAAKYAADNKIRLYIINVEPEFASPKYALLRKHLEQDTALTGGQFFLAGDSRTLGEIYKEIEELEKSALPSSQLSYLQDSPVEKVQKRLQAAYFAPWLMAVAALLFLSALAVETLVFRRVP